jgi:hypothetical protein
MADLRLTHVPITKTGMLVRKPVADVFEAFVNPDITTQFLVHQKQRKAPGRHGTTFVSITEAGFIGDGDELVKQVTDSTQGFSLVLAGLKALLEHSVRLNLVADRYPEGIEEH